ncbi:hypothetical protein VKT23_011845 [Stygiomarasmius scandens]|uniref:Uncharacterized protein n=1 Tax=Marasmiellus scandens TaxID=2682957 RepID=A0ABR1J948_9AGAR
MSFLSSFSAFPITTIIAPFISFLLLRNHFVKKETILSDLPFLGQERKQENKIQAAVHGAAVVCGGSLAGLLTARICADHFEKVYIVEPEAWVFTSEEGVQVESWKQKNKRTRVMQYYSAHGNLLPVTFGLKKLFPDFERECQRSGISLLPANFNAYLMGNKLLCPYEEYEKQKQKREHGGTLPKSAASSRQATETLVRRLTLDKKRYPNITCIPGLVVGVERKEGQEGYLGKVVVQRDTGVREEIDAALVIDCTGPARAGIKWLRQTGFGGGVHPLEDLTVSYDPQMRYASFKFNIPSQLALDRGVPEFISATKEVGMFTYRGGKECPVLVAASKLEGDRVLVTCGTWGIDNLPEDVDGVREFIKSTLPTDSVQDWIWKFLDLCKEVEDTVEYCSVRTPPSSWTHFESASDLPSNWIAMGDSVSRVNPIYAQGGCKAVMGVAALNTLLYGLEKNEIRGIPEDFSKRFFRVQADKIKPIWTGNKMIDYSYDTTIPEQGETLEAGSYIRWYLHQLELLSAKDKQVGSLIWHSMNALGASIDIVNPTIVGKVIFHALTGFVLGSW